MPTYKAIFRSDELYHFNKNHDRLGRFDTGDGDGDGIIDDHHYKKLDKMSGERLYKTLKKEVKKKRKELHGWENQWAWTTMIGKNSEKLYKDRMALEKKYVNSPEFKAWDKALRKLDREWESSSLDKYDYYEKKWDELYSKQPKRNYDPIFATVIYGNDGRKYADNFITRGGKDMSLAYLKDLGYSDTKAKEYVDKMIEANRTLG